MVTMEMLPASDGLVGCASPLRVGEVVRPQERSPVSCLFYYKLSISTWGNWVGGGAEG